MMAEESSNEGRQELKMVRQSDDAEKTEYQPDKGIAAGYQPDDTGTVEDGNPPTVEDTIEPGGKD